ncbi:MAG: FAD/NAD(P)-binding protein [Chloroflexota bacterium]
MLDWLIIGGGMLGTTISNYLVNAYGVPAANVRVLDPHAEPLAQWNRYTGNTGMRYMRSAQIHHVDTEHFSLQNYMNAHPAPGNYIRPYRRPAYDLFQAHTAHTINACNLADLRLQGTAEFIMTTKGGMKVETSSGVIRARRVVLAIGRTALNIPSWAQPLRENGAPIHHIFDWHFNLHTLEPEKQTVIVGGGITAGQVALHLTAQQPVSVTMLMRHAITEHDFDSSPCWLGPKCSGMFRRTPTPTARRQLITQARNRGSMSSDVAKHVREALREQMLTRVQGEIVRAEYADERVKLHLADGNTLTTDRVLLATGFDMARPGGAWLDEVIDWFGLPTADCGYPIVNQKLCWGAGIHVSGALAELELGPPAGNIVGGRLAAERLKILT